jgi:hypothetical protein
MGKKLTANVKIELEAQCALCDGEIIIDPVHDIFCKTCGNVITIAEVKKALVAAIENMANIPQEI